MAESEEWAFLEQCAPVEDVDEAARALMGAVIHGVLDHVGAKDLERWNLDSVDDVTLGRIRSVMNRGDTGLHGCGFEYAVHAALNDNSRIPQSVRGIVTTTVTSEVAVILDQLDVPVSGWSNPLRAVMVGSERRTRQGGERGEGQGTALREFDVRVRDELGLGALIWGSREVGPQALWPLVPDLRCTTARRDARNPSDATRRGYHQLPPELSRLWQADLLIGGADVRRTDAVKDALTVLDLPFVGLPTAWVAATVKYPRRRAEPGPGIHLAIETAYGGSGNPVRSERIQRTGHQGLRGVRLPLDGDFVRAFNRAYSLLTTWVFLGTKRAHPRDVPEFASRRLYSFLADSRSRRARALAEELLRHGSDIPAADFAAELNGGENGDVVQVVNTPKTDEASVRNTTIAPLPEAIAA